MTKKIWLILAAALVVAGGMLFGGVMMAQNWDFHKLQTTKFETNTHRIQDSFVDVSIDVDTTKVTILPTQENTTTVTCFEQEKVKHTVEVKDNTLTIQVMDTRAWYEYISFSFQSPRITVYLPEKIYGMVAVTGSTADVQIDALSADTLNLSLSTGEMMLSNIQVKTIKATASTGDIHLKNVIANQEFSVETGTGDLMLEGCDAERLWLKATTGDITGWLLSPKVFIAQTHTGDVNVPQTTEGGLCEIYTNTGDIDIDALLAHITTP